MRFLAVFIVASILLGAIIYSQWRPVPLQVSGLVEADEIRLGSRLGGRVLKVHVNEGSRVEKGQVLIEFEPYDLAERLQEASRNLAARELNYQRLAGGLREEEKLQAVARFEQAKARLELLQAGPRKEEIESARAQLEAAQAVLRAATSNFQRVTELAQSNAMTQAELESAQESLDQATAAVAVRKEALDVLLAGARNEELREAESRLEEAKQGMLLAEKGNRYEDIQAAAALRDAAAAVVAAIERQRDELTIKSPCDGTVEALDLQPGDMVGAGAPVVSILDDSTYWVRAYVPQNAHPVSIGDRLRIEADTLPDKLLAGSVSFIARQAEFTPSNAQTTEERAKQVFRIKIQLDGQHEALHPGMTVSVYLNSEDHINREAHVSGQTK